MKNIAKNKVSLNPGCFSPDQALAEFSAGFLDQGACCSWILDKLHGSYPKCPECRRGIDDEKRLQRFFSGQRISCRHCGKFFTATTGTFLAGSHMNYSEIFLLAVLLAAGLDNLKISACLDATPETVRLWRRRFDSVSEIKGG